MGVFDRLFSKQKDDKLTQGYQMEDAYEKSRLASSVSNLVDKIKRINSFDSSIWNIQNYSIRDFERMSLQDLQHLNERLSRTLDSLQRESQRRNPNREKLEEAKWTGTPTKGMSDRDLETAQRRDDYR